MKLIDELYKVLAGSEADGVFQTTIQLNSSHIIYSGHFPGHPVTPAVIQLQIVHELLEHHLGQGIKLVSISQCKFLQMLDPGRFPQLALHIACKPQGEMLQVKATGQNPEAVFFKLEAVYSLVAGMKS